MLQPVKIRGMVFPEVMGQPSWVLIKFNKNPTRLSNALSSKTILIVIQVKVSTDSHSKPYLDPRLLNPGAEATIISRFLHCQDYFYRGSPTEKYPKIKSVGSPVF
jgi:hypothetical protein